MNQQEIDLQARIGELERLVAELAAKVNPAWSSGIDQLARGGYLRFGPEGSGVTELGPRGIQFLASLLNDDVGFMALVERFALSKDDLDTIYPRWVLSGNLDSTANPKTVGAVLHRTAIERAGLLWSAGSASQGMGFFGPAFSMHGTLALPESLEDAGTLGVDISSGTLTMMPYTVNYVNPESGTTDELDTISIPSNYDYTRGLVVCLRTTGSSTITCRTGTGNLSLGSDITLTADKPLWLWYDKGNTAWLPMVPNGGSMKAIGGGSYALSVSATEPPIISLSGWVHISHPVVRSKPTTFTGASGSSHAVTMPTTVGASERVICIVAVDGDRTITTPSGWTLVGSQNTSTGSPDVRVSVYYRDGSPGATVTFTLNSASVLHAMTYLLSANSFYGAPTVAFNSGTAGGTMDPPSLARPNSTYTATLWIECAAEGNSTTAATASTTFGNLVERETTNLSLACANRFDDIDPMDPGGMNVASGNNWVAATIAQAGYGIPEDAVLLAVTTDQDNVAIATGASGSQTIRGQVAAPPGVSNWVRCALPAPVSVTAGDILWLSSGGRVELLDEADIG